MFHRSTSWPLVGCLVAWAVVAWGLVAAGAPAWGCTTAVVSGKATADGRPLLWKNRDAPHQNNQVALFAAPGMHRAVAVVNAGSRGAVWMGVNDQGFCIENSLCRDLTEAEAKGIGNGGLMLRALQTCATVQQFEQLLRDTNGKRSTNASFGVIDRHGGAMLFETRGSSYARFDANDPRDAPQGYIVRSNFAFSAQRPQPLADEQAIARLYSGNRYLRATALLEQALLDGKATHKYLLRHCARDLADPAGQPLRGTLNGPLGPLPERIDTTSTISRRTSVSAAVFRGVLPHEDPRLTTMWVMLGEPAFSIAVPCWAAAESVAPPLLGDETSPFCTAVRRVRESNYHPATTRDGPEMLAPAPLPHIWRHTLALEDELLATTERRLEQWRTAPPTREALTTTHRAGTERAFHTVQSLATAPMPTAAPVADPKAAAPPSEPAAAIPAAGP